MLFTNPRQQGTRFKGMFSESNQELQTAVSENNLELVERLLQRDDIKHNQGNKFNALYRAVNHKNLAMMQLIMQDPEIEQYANEDYNGPLITACMKGAVEVVKALLSLDCVANSIASWGNQSYKKAFNGHRESTSQEEREKFAEIIDILLDYSDVKQALKYERDADKAYVIEQENKFWSEIFSKFHNIALPKTIKSALKC